MSQRIFAFAGVLTFAASSLAEAASLPLAPAPASAGHANAAAWVDPPTKMAVKQPAPAPLAQPTLGAGAISRATEPAPASAPAKTVAAEAPASTPKTAPVTSAVARKADGVSVRSRNEERVRYAGNEGGAWRVGRDAFGFSGSFGGCRFTGFAGPNGYRLDRVC